jgi:hypothetical protein
MITKMLRIATNFITITTLSSNNILNRSDGIEQFDSTVDRNDNKC